MTPTTKRQRRWICRRRGGEKQLPVMKSFLAMTLLSVIISTITTTYKQGGHGLLLESCSALSVKTLRVDSTRAEKRTRMAATIQSRRWNGNGNLKKKGSSATAPKNLGDVPYARKMKFNITSPYGQTQQLHKQRQESIEHVLTKAMIWKLFLEEEEEYKARGYDTHSSVKFDIEIDIGDPDYTPDVVGMMTRSSSSKQGSSGIDDSHTSVSEAVAAAAATENTIVYWGESGRMKPHKALNLMKRYSNARLIHCRWGIDLDTFVDPFMEYLVERIEHGDIEHPFLGSSSVSFSSSSWWNGRFSFATVPADMWKFIDESDSGMNKITLSKSDLVWKELDIDLVNEYIAKRSS
mmetsp:Transcript_47017/g.114722  ORF Transcript_47017/g.114722 Transcript_47017/m.114722 type:complete len:350 (-) Transcript_47017:1768-2817(-)